MCSFSKADCMTPPLCEDDRYAETVCLLSRRPKRVQVIGLDFRTAQLTGGALSGIHSLRLFMPMFRNYRERRDCDEILSDLACASPTVYEHSGWMCCGT